MEALFYVLFMLAPVLIPLALVLPIIGTVRITRKSPGRRQKTQLAAYWGVTGVALAAAVILAWLGMTSPRYDEAALAVVLALYPIVLGGGVALFVASVKSGESLRMPMLTESAAREPEDYFLRAVRANTVRDNASPMSLIKKLSLSGATLVALAPTCIVVGFIVTFPCAMSDLSSKDCSTTEAIGMTLFWLGLACIVPGLICLAMAAGKWMARRREM